VLAAAVADPDVQLAVGPNRSWPPLWLENWWWGIVSTGLALDGAARFASCPERRYSTMCRSPFVPV
jgi:hypothetical protein